MIGKKAPYAHSPGSFKVLRKTTFYDFVNIASKRVREGDRPEFLVIPLALEFLCLKGIGVSRCFISKNYLLWAYIFCFTICGTASVQAVSSKSMTTAGNRQRAWLLCKEKMPIAMIHLGVTWLGHRLPPIPHKPSLRWRAFRGEWR